MNTCGEESLFAVGDGTEVVASVTLAARGSSEGLMPAIRRLFADARVRVMELDGVGVVHGPGSFTGARVGLAAAKGLCHAANLPLAAMSRLALVAAELEDSHALALLDAGRGEYYAGLYAGGGSKRMWERLLPKLAVERLLAGEAEVAGPTMGEQPEGVTCEVRVATSFGERVKQVPEPGAAQMLRMLTRRAEAGDWSDLATVDANYLRRTDAELLVEERRRDTASASAELSA